MEEEKNSTPSASTIRVTIDRMSARGMSRVGFLASSAVSVELLDGEEHVHAERQRQHDAGEAKGQPRAATFLDPRAVSGDVQRVLREIHMRDGDDEKEQQHEHGGDGDPDHHPHGELQPSHRQAEHHCVADEPPERKPAVGRAEDGGKIEPR